MDKLVERLLFEVENDPKKIDWAIGKAAALLRELTVIQTKNQTEIRPSS